MKQIEIAVTKVDRGALIAVQVNKRCGIVGAVTFEVSRILRAGGDERNGGRKRLERVVRQLWTFRNNVVGASASRRQQLDQVVALAVNPLIAVGTVIRH